MLVKFKIVGEEQVISVVSKIVEHDSVEEMISAGGGLGHVVDPQFLSEKNIDPTINNAYQKAMCVMFQSSDKGQQLRKDDPERYLSTCDKMRTYTGRCCSFRVSPNSMPLH